MKKLILTTAIFLMALGVVLPPAAEARVFVGVGVGGCCGGYYPGYYQPYYYPYGYVAPPPVVYAVPPPSPVVYASPPQTVVVQQPAAPVAGAPPPSYDSQQPSPTYTDSKGRTCRQFQSSSGGEHFGTACLMPDGSWQTVVP